MYIREEGGFERRRIREEGIYSREVKFIRLYREEP